MGVEYQGLDDPLVRFGHARAVFLESLSKGALIETIGTIVKAQVLARSLIQLRLGRDAGPDDQPGTPPDLEGPLGDFLGGLDVGDL